MEHGQQGLPGRPARHHGHQRPGRCGPDHRRRVRRTGPPYRPDVADDREGLRGTGGRGSRSSPHRKPSTRPRHRCCWCSATRRGAGPGSSSPAATTRPTRRSAAPVRCSGWPGAVSGHRHRTDRVGHRVPDCGRRAGALRRLGAASQPRLSSGAGLGVHLTHVDRPQAHLHPRGESCSWTPASALESTISSEPEPGLESHVACVDGIGVRQLAMSFGSTSSTMLLSLSTVTPCARPGRRRPPVGTASHSRRVVRREAVPSLGAVREVVGAGDLERPRVRGRRVQGPGQPSTGAARRRPLSSKR